MPSHATERFIKIAEKAALAGQHRRYRVGAVLVKNGNVMSIGANSYKTHPRMGPKTLHAEIAALLGVGYRDLTGCHIYVVRLNRTGRVGMARPCEVCSRVLNEMGIKRAYFSNEKGLVERANL